MLPDPALANCVIYNRFTGNPESPPIEVYVYQINMYLVVCFWLVFPRLFFFIIRI
jgi:hypothetical protein